MKNFLLVLTLWAIGLTLALFGIELIDNNPDESLEEFFGHLCVGLGLMFMILCGRAER